MLQKKKKKRASFPLWLHLAGPTPSCSLTSSLHPLRQVKRFSCLTACSTASTASDLFPYESSAPQSDTAPSLGGSNTSGCREISPATCGGIQPTCAPSTSKRRQLGRQEPEERRNYCQPMLRNTALRSPPCLHRTWEIEAVHSAEKLHYFLRPSTVSHSFFLLKNWSFKTCQLQQHYYTHKVVSGLKTQRWTNDSFIMNGKFFTTLKRNAYSQHDVAPPNAHVTNVFFVVCIFFFIIHCLYFYKQLLLRLI